MVRDIFSNRERKMNGRFCIAVVTTLSVISWSAVNADDAEKALKNIVSIGPGVHEIQKDGKGRIVSCVIVGQARISEVLGASKGIQTARQKADLAASAEFVKWLNEKVQVIQSSEEETIILLEGTANGKTDNLTESGKAVEKNSVKMQSVSEGLVKGLQIIYSEVDSENKTYSVAKGWSLKNSNAVAAVKDKIDNPGKVKPEKNKPKESGDKGIKSKSAVSEDAGQFLKKPKS